MKIKTIPVHKYSNKEENLLRFLGEKSKVKIEEKYSCECGHYMRIRHLNSTCPECKSEVKYRKIILAPKNYKRYDIEREIKENDLL